MLYPFGFFHVKFFHHPIMRSLYLSLFILLLLIQPLYSQPMPKPATNNDYQKDWELVAKKVREGLPKSAQELVEGIYRRAKSEKNVAQQVKALMHLVQYTAALEEDGILKSLSRLEAEAQQATFPVSPVLYSLLADIYWKYYQRNRYRFLGRTSTTQVLEQDIRTWSLAQLLERIIRCHQLALQDMPQLQKTPLSIYDSILDTAAGSKTYRPTLFDFLAHRALDFYTNDEAGLPKPLDEFELLSLDGLKPASEFVRVKFETSDTLSLKYLALRLYQDLIAFHLSDPKPDALIDVDILRLKYAHALTFNENKDEVYVQSLRQLEQAYRTHPASTDALYALAEHYATLGGTQGSDGLNGRQRALKICEEAIARAPNSRGAINCKSLKSELLQKQFRLVGERCVAPNQPFRVLASYQNFGKAYFRLVRLPDTDKWRYEQADGRIEQALKLKPIRTFTQVFPLPNDLLEHRAEFKVEALPKGHYALLMSAREDFVQENNITQILEFWVTSLSLMTTNVASDDEASKTFFVLDAQTGKPLSGAKAQLFHGEYDYQRNQYRITKMGQYTSDAEGKFVVRNASYAFRVELRYQDDRFIPPDQFFVSRRYPDTQVGEHTITLFTDRSIYRPGQTIYFKGILLKAHADRTRHDVVPNEPVSVTLYDVNGEKVSTLSLSTNQYGTFHGSFLAPTGVLTGRMRIEARSKGSGNTFVQVEEYKRPKFEVGFNPVQGSYRLNEKVRLTGFARSYAGANVTDATVKFRVVREVMFPLWWQWWLPRPKVPDREIAHGTLQTNDKGEFVVEFVATPDRSVPENQYPEFTYTVYADVTDLSGETRSAQTAVQVGYLALRLSLTLPEKIDKTRPPSVSIETQNLSGTFEPAQGTLKLYKINPPARVKRSRLWDTPDQVTMTKAEHDSLFPDDYYANEDNEDQLTSENVGTLPQVFRFDNRTKPETIPIPFASLETGDYLVAVETQDRFGKPLKLEKRFTLYSSLSTELATRVPSFFAIPDERSYEPGDTFRFVWGSAYPDVEAYYELEHRGRIIKQERLNARRSQQVYRIPIVEDYCGNVTFRIYFVHRYRFYQEEYTIAVPWSNKTLKAEWMSFRSKIVPGAQEEWRLKLSGSKGEQVSAEMLATLYDASLDAFLPHRWSLFPYPSFAPQISATVGQALAPVFAESRESEWNRYEPPYAQGYDALFFEDSRSARRRLLAAKGSRRRNEDEGTVGAAISSGIGFVGSPAPGLGGGAALSEASSQPDREGEAAPSPSRASSAVSRQQPSPTDFQTVQIRKNLNETAFFFPALTTNDAGEIVFRFRVPEALTRWRFLGWAHTKDVRIGEISAESVTQKDLMIQPNPPRFLRENDELEFPVKITNLSGKDLTGTAQLSLLDATTLQPLGLQGLGEQPFNVKAGGNVALFWRIKVPAGISAIAYRAVAKAGNFSDGEENVLPALTDKILVTETLPLPVRAKQTKSFELTKLLNASSPTLRHERLTLEFTSNPAWYAVQALPYLMEFPHECTEQTFARYYANSLAAFVANSSPKIQRVFEKWKTESPSALLSNLEKNQELKQALLEETPWVFNGRSESERKQRIALLFDLNTLAQSLKQAEQKLVSMQLPSGGFPWFPGMSESRWVTQHIAAGVGHLDKLGIYKRPKNVMLISAMPTSLGQAISRALKYLDEEMTREYESILKHSSKPDDDHLSYLAIHYLYTRSYFPDIPVDGGERQTKALQYWVRQAKQYWASRNIMLKGMLALTFHRSGNSDDRELAQRIMRSIKEYALMSDELGMYWKDNIGGYYWYQAPIETQSLLIECFDEILDDQSAVEAMKTWLLKHKQTHDWRTTKATAEACYALLLRGTALLESELLAEVTLGSMRINPKTLPDLATEAGTGYFKTAWVKEAVKPEYGKVTVKNPNDGVAWGALYWQYFEQMDKVTPADSPLKLKKQLFRERLTSKGKVLEPITDKTPITVGDVVKVRLELRVDRDMEFVHLKDLRATGFEPLSVLSQYKFQDGLGYYESTRDVATHFFMDYVRKGVYVFEYSLRTVHRGKFQSGIATIQCMYAPEFSSHSESVLLDIR
jgi:hypothetical protein